MIKDGIGSKNSIAKTLFTIVTSDTCESPICDRFLDEQLSRVMWRNGLPT